MNCYVYVLLSVSGPRPRTYVGWTTDLDLRLAKHNMGAGARFTRGGRWVMVYAERHATRAAAMRREWELKRDRGFRARLRADAAAGLTP